ncbi:MAG: hypothetical protein KAY22_12475 [Rhizorhabdus sp.]|uniref:hypothetical protein n=1 Tax=Rhizorhabdus sp. TaxID=1968843 RepID=UPI001B590965|nr:hypothetical protein [Rhizorhabdus sp.]MBP8233114.1 hypothetical protein [Rhizorhabdus sp.]
MIVQWSHRAEQLLEDPAVSSAQAMRATSLQDIVRDLKRRLAAAGPPPTADEARLQELEASLACLQPYMHPVYKMMFNNGPITAAVRASIERRLGREPAEVVPLSAPRPRWLDAPIEPPALDPEPFTPGPQMDMFG